MPRDVDRAFQHCVTLLRQGVSLAECVARYPQHSDELQPMLAAVAEKTRITPDAAMPLAARARIRQMVLSEWDSRRSPSMSHRGISWMHPRWATLAVIVLALMFSGTSIVMASDTAIPGGALYPVKQLKEEARLWFARSPEARTTIYTSLMMERVSEIRKLAETDASSSVGIAVDRLEHHIYDADRLVRESSGGGQEAKQGMGAAILEALDSVIAQHESVSIEIQENLGQTPASMYPCLQHTFEAIQRGRERVRLAVEAIGHVLPETSSQPVISDTNLCPP